VTEDGYAGAFPDPVARSFTADPPGVKIVGDVTYIPTRVGWLHLPLRSIAI